MEHHESDIEGSMSGGEHEIMSEEEDDNDSRNSNGSRNGLDAQKPPQIDPEMLARLKQHGIPFGQDDLQGLPFFFPSPHMMAQHFAATATDLIVKKDKDMIQRERSPLHYAPEETLPQGQAPKSDDSTSSTSSQQTWSFEEQFKQLYELSDDIKRKEFLDELFTFMQKRGSPINRLPIMAKQVLDLYELYNLVIARGGLVDVINKKLWQEIIKGLHLPSSITSAAFTLRTQYMKYLYPYECDKKRLSTPSELQAAIDGNRREGRRASYGPGGYGDVVSDFMQISPMSLAGGRPLMNGNGNSHQMHSTSPNSPPPNSASNARDALAALELSRLTLWNLYGGGGMPQQPPPEAKVPPQQEALNLEVPTRSSEGAHTPKVPWPFNNNNDVSPQQSKYDAANLSHKERHPDKENGKRHHHDHHMSDRRPGSGSEAPPLKRERLAHDDGMESSPVSRHNTSSNSNNNNPIITGNGTSLGGHSDRIGSERRSSSSERSDRERERERSASDHQISRDLLLDRSDRERVREKEFLLNTLRDHSRMSGEKERNNATHIKINSRGDSRGDTSMVVSLEVNGIMYQGVLFAQSPTRVS